MRLRFLKTTSSQNPDFPFQAGQILDVSELTTEMRIWLEREWAVLLPEADEAATVAPDMETATVPRARKRGGR